MKTIEVDEELYRYIASHTQHIGESASDILRRMLKFDACKDQLQPAQSPGKAGTDKQDKARLLQAFLLSNEYTSQSKSINRFMLILTTLFHLDAGQFAMATESLHGRTRRYFAYDEQTLLACGAHTKPKMLEGTPYWVITNTNTGRKRGMIEHIMQAMQLSDELIDKVCSSI